MSASRPSLAELEKAVAAGSLNAKYQLGEHYRDQSNAQQAMRSFLTSYHCAKELLVANEEIQAQQMENLEIAIKVKADCLAELEKLIPQLPTVEADVLITEMVRIYLNARSEISDYLNLAKELFVKMNKPSDSWREFFELIKTTKQYYQNAIIDFNIDFYIDGLQFYTGAGRIKSLSVAKDCFLKLSITRKGANILFAETLLAMENKVTLVEQIEAFVKTYTELDFVPGVAKRCIVVLENLLPRLDDKHPACKNKVLLLLGSYFHDQSLPYHQPPESCFLEKSVGYLSQVSEVKDEMAADLQRNELPKYYAEDCFKLGSQYLVKDQKQKAVESFKKAYARGHIEATYELTKLDINVEYFLKCLEREERKYMVKNVLIAALNNLNALGVENCAKVFTLGFKKLINGQNNYLLFDMNLNSLMDAVGKNYDLTAKLKDDENLSRILAFISENEVENIYYHIKISDNADNIVSAFKKIKAIYDRYKDKYRYDAVEFRLALIQILLKKSTLIDDPDRVKRLSEHFVSQALLHSNEDAMKNLAEMRFMQGDKNRPIFWLFLILVVRFAKKGNMGYFSYVTSQKIAKGLEWGLSIDRSLEERARRFRKLMHRIEEKYPNGNSLPKTPLLILQELQNENRIKKALSDEGIELSKWLAREKAEAQASKIVAQKYSESKLILFPPAQDQAQEAGKAVELQTFGRKPNGTP